MEARTRPFQVTKKVSSASYMFNVITVQLYVTDLEKLLFIGISENET